MTSRYKSLFSLFAEPLCYLFLTPLPYLLIPSTLEMLTHGQPCCLVLVLEVDPENEGIAIGQTKAMKMGIFLP